MSKLEVDAIEPQSGTTLTLGASGDTVTIPSGATLSGTSLALTGNIGIGGATPTTSGTGITFPATASASTNANTLDDYEEGTWTAAYADSSSTHTGIYTKIGNKVYVSVNASSISVTSGGVNAEITGLPFTVGSHYSTGTIVRNSYTTNGGGNGFFGATSTTFFILQENSTSQSTTNAGTKTFMFSGFYTIAG